MLVGTEKRGIVARPEFERGPTAGRSRVFRKRPSAHGGLRPSRKAIRAGADAMYTAWAQPGVMKRSYAIIWSRSDERVYAGRLEIGETAVRILGAAAQRRARAEEIPLSEIVAVTPVRRRSDRLRHLPTIAVRLREGAPIFVATVDEAGRSGELALTLEARLTEAA
jgi:hypothetical protein